MKTLLICFTLLTLVACGSSNTKVIDQPVVKPDTTSNESVGTRGGGGTLVFTFKNAALQAKTKMESNALLFEDTPANEAINDFYAARRNLWISALSQVVNDPNAVFQTPDSLTDFKLTVGAKALPENNPTYIVLSEPYLTSGFSNDQAFVLAVHESGHLISPNMTEAEHQFLDEIGMALLKK